MMSPKLPDLGQSEPDAITVRIPTALKMIGLGRSKFYELVQEGEIELIKVGRTSLVLVESLHTFVARHRQSGS
jgi:excisionase family DNA binding protein